MEQCNKHGTTFDKFAGMFCVECFVDIQLSIKRDVKK